MQLNIDHPQRRQYGCEDLIGMDAARFTHISSIIPGNHALGQRTGMASFGDSHFEIDQLRQRLTVAFQHFVDSIDKGIETAVSRTGGDLFPTLYPDTNADGRFEIETAGDGTVQQLYMLIAVAFEHVGNNEGEVVGGNRLLGVAQFDDSCQHPLLLLFRERQAQFFEVLFERGLSAHFPQRIAPRSRKTLRTQFAFVKTALLIPIGVNSRCLGKDIRPDDRCVGGDPFAGKVLDHLAQSDDVALIDRQCHPHLIA